MSLSGPPSGDPATEPRAQRIARILLVGGLLVLAGWTLRFFLPALVWAGILAIAVWPLYHRMGRGRLQGDRLVRPAVFTLAVALLFLLPFLLLAIAAVEDMHALTRLIEHANQAGIDPPVWLNSLPLVGIPLADWWHDHLAHPGWGADLLAFARRPGLLDTGRLIGVQVAHRLTLMFSALLALFFVLRDGDRLAAQAIRAGERMFGPNSEPMLRHVAASVHGVVDGLVLVGLGVGFIMGIAYAATSVPHPALLGALTAMGAIIPFGAPLVIGIAVLLLLAQGAVISAVVIVALGVATTFIADHFVRPVLIGGATSLPFPFVLFGVLGGLEAWGLFGLFLGPALLTVLVMLWREWVA